MIHGAHLVLLMAMAQGMADEQPATVNGTVLDAGGSGLGGVKAELMDCFTHQVTKIVIADTNGNFTLVPDADAHSYCLRFSGTGFAPFEMNVEAREVLAEKGLHVRLPGSWAGKTMN